MPDSLTLFFHQDTWHRDQLAFDEDHLQNLSTMLVGTSYCTFFYWCTVDRVPLILTRVINRCLSFATVIHE